MRPVGTNAVPVDAARLRSWFEARRQADAQPDTQADTQAVSRQAIFRQAAAFFTLLEATGRSVPGALWQSLLDRPFTGDAGGGGVRDAGEGVGLNAVWTHSLEAASMDARLGETVLLATVGVGDAGDKGLSLADAARVIVALRRVGLEAEARRLAVETAMAAGL
jgi:hypothetical protein